jgi:hypothetical protein
MESKMLKKSTWLAIPAALVVMMPVLAATPPAKTYQPGFWQPAARVNPNAPISVVIVNQSRIKIEYDFSGNSTSIATLQPGQSATYAPGSTQLPAYLAVNSTNDTRLKYLISVEGNVATIKLREIGAKEEGETSLTIDTTGAIYFY